jgi:hypothetical protein
MLALLAALLQAASPVPIDLDAISRATPTVAVDIDGGRWKGEPRRLAWSPDGETIYVQFVEGGDPARAKASHALVALGTKQVRKIDAEPDWAAAYWRWKSAQTAPGRPALKIEVEQRTEAVTATATPMGGDLARGGTNPGTAGVSVEEVSGTYNQRQMVTVFELRLRGQSLGAWRNEAVVPGLTFGWAPASLGPVIAFIDRDGRLALLSGDGRKSTLGATRDARLPAWDEAGARLAGLARSGRRGWSLLLLPLIR